MSEARGATWVWDRYWAADRVAACLDAAEANYSGDVRALWEDVFAALPSGARILDVGTGNGAIAIIAAEVGRRDGRQFEIHGIDSADIDPASHVSGAAASIAAIQFHPRTPAERLPFADDCFDLACAHFALEYTDLDRSIGELVRVLRPRGRLELLLHADASFVLEATRAQLGQIRLVEEAGLLEAVEALLRSVHADGRPGIADEAKPGHRETKEAFNAAARRIIAQGYSSGPPQFLDALLQLLGEIYQQRRTMSLEQALAALTDTRLELEAHRGRLEAQLAAALTPDALEALLAKFRAAGLAARAGEAWERERSRLLGWRVSATQEGA